ncbi:hypothetical protein [Paraburkholderia antibiotica]|uniref:Uncharacterized protein n=1 Tax=Paraburkholderia antibiotica TaxID=2728839 RepID=A0A7X9ZZH1_9BURK|nr:hypothetical protein [Paraburkholderia antibiotica]NML32618.1 hypothetical protein [Paraburkholderia antibiotica]
MGLTTAQGQLAQSLTVIIGDWNSDVLEVENQFDPDMATGRMTANAAIERRLMLHRTIRCPHGRVGIPVVEFRWAHDVLLDKELRGLICNRDFLWKPDHSGKHAG